MTDRPILFSAPMVRALLEDRKTQTRRTCGLFGAIDPDEIEWSPRSGDFEWKGQGTLVGNGLPRFSVGDRLYVREAWQTTNILDEVSPSNLKSTESFDVPYTPIRFEADGATTDYHPHSDPDFGKLRSSIHMPRWASRITLTVTDVRVQRLQEISREDAIAEGLIKMPSAPPMAINMGCDWGFDGDNRHGSPVSAYAALWDHINGPGSWDANPWVAAYTFGVTKGNIDKIGGEP